MSSRPTLSGIRPPLAIEVCEQHHGGEKEEKFAGAPIRTGSSSSQHRDRRSHWLYDNCANSHLTNYVHRLEFEITELPVESCFAAGSGNFQIVCEADLRLGRLSLCHADHVPG